MDALETIMERLATSTRQVIIDEARKVGFSELEAEWINWDSLRGVRIGSPGDLQLVYPEEYTAYIDGLYGAAGICEWLGYDWKHCG
jgi:hypothetical protein